MAALPGDGAEDLEELFEAAAAYVAAVAGGDSLTTETKLSLYGFYKQATCGPCDLQRPSFFDRKGRAKWAAWADLGNMSAPEAQAKYIALLTEASPEFLQQLQSDVQPKQKQAMGPVFSSLANEEPDSAGGGMAAESLHMRANEGDLAGVGSCLASGADIDGRDQEGCTALHWAADRGHLEVVEYLLDHGADVNARDYDGQTPLHYGALCENRQVCERLLRAGADASIQDSSGDTAAVAAPESWGEVWEVPQAQ
ncbi:hypothetical protein WJX72_002723 [[Myrmecia] bisecta]|uniref:ACB domain-containing protein n=1 Tax=[Myrmecia] bisecta TaxID=41462 RepID=A0AAW1QPL9_9CHLO